MGWNGAGVFNRLMNWAADKAAVIPITASRMDTDANDFATAGLGNCITRDGQGQPTANLPMATFRHTGVANGVARTDYAAMGQLEDGTVNWAAAGGGADALAATYIPALTALIDGQLCWVRAAAANATTTPTFAPNGLTVHTITKVGGAPVAVGDIAGSGHELILRYKLASTVWELLNPALPIVYSNDAGAGVLPSLDIFRDSASPAVSDFIGSVDFNGRDSAGNKQLYAQIVPQITDPVSATEDAILILRAVVAGTLTDMLKSSAAGITIVAALSVGTTIAMSGAISGVTAPTVQKFTSGSAQTYTPTAGMVRIRVRMCGGGGGAGAQVTNNGTTGNTTTFGTWTAIGGGAGSTGPSFVGGTGGTAGTNGTGTPVVRIDGGDGGTGGQSATAGVFCGPGSGGTNPFGGAGRGGPGGAGTNGKANTGAGGGGSNNGAGTNSSGGGAAGEYVEFWMTAAQVGASLTYTVGATAAGGVAGTFKGGDGAAGIIIIEEFYS